MQPVPSQNNPPDVRGLAAVLRRATVLAAIAAIYFAAGKFGLHLAFFNPSASPVWPPAGIALVAFLLLGPSVTPAILVGAFLVNLTTAGSAWTSLIIAVGNTLEGFVGAWLVHRWAGGVRAFSRPRWVVAFALLAAGFSTMIAATIGVTSLTVGGYAPWTEYRTIWLTWWLGDAAGDLVVAPALLLWVTAWRRPWSRARVGEAAVLLFVLVLTGQFVFGPLSAPMIQHAPLEFLCVPVLLWAAFRLGVRETTAAVLLLSAMAIRGTLSGFGPFVRGSPNESLLLLQAFAGVVSIMSLVVAAAVAEHHRVQGRLQEMSVTDPLTGLANYRRLVSVLEEEIRRSGRTERPFGLVFLDMDDLKVINDHHGHLVGNRALLRLATVLQGTCRAVDTAARYGGDEFAIVLPETDREAAREVAGRIAERLTRDKEVPPITVSLGVAVHPGDGATAEALIGTADRALYAMKRRRLLEPT